MAEMEKQLQYIANAYAFYLMENLTNTLVAIFIF